MKEPIENRIIAISGEPVSGKGTTIKKMVEILKEQGYSENNIHVISTGQIFRDFFELIIEYMKNVDNQEELGKLKQDRMLRYLLDNPEYYEVLLNTISDVKGKVIDLNDSNKISELNNSPIFNDLRNVVDTLIDGSVKRMGEQINQQERKDEIWIFDSRIAFKNIPNAFSVRLTVDSKEAAKRLFNDTTRGEEDRYNSIEEAEIAREERRKGEIKRYKEGYGIDLEDKKNYNLILDATNIDAEARANIILEKEKEYRQQRDKLINEGEGR